MPHQLNSHTHTQCVYITKDSLFGPVCSKEDEGVPGGAVQWDEMNILMTEHPPGEFEQLGPLQ